MYIPLLIYMIKLQNFWRHGFLCIKGCLLFSKRPLCRLNKPFSKVVWMTYNVRGLSAVQLLYPADLKIQQPTPSRENYTMNSTFFSFLIVCILILKKTPEVMTLHVNSPLKVRVKNYILHGKVRTDDESDNDIN